MNLRYQLYKHLEPSAWKTEGLSPLNAFIICVILLASIVAIIETEVEVRNKAEAFFDYSESIFATIFIAEYLARLYAAGENPKYRGFFGRLKYVTSFWALIDFFAILPFLLVFIPYNGFILRLMRLVRLLRLARLGRFSNAWDSLGQAISERRYELAISAVVAGLFLVFSSSCLYILEASAQPESFGSIPRALWWSIATLTTVGYGDVTPITPLGKFFASLTAIAGIGMIAMPTGILASAFSDVLQRHKNKKIS